MERIDVQMLGFEIVAYAGDARSKLLTVLQLATQGEFDQVDSLIKEADELIAHAHRSQTLMLQEEALGHVVPYSFTMIHGQDHLMTTMLLRDMIETFVLMLKHTNTK